MPKSKFREAVVVEWERIRRSVCWQTPFLFPNNAQSTECQVVCPIWHKNKASDLIAKHLKYMNIFSLIAVPFRGYCETEEMMGPLLEHFEDATIGIGKYRELWLNCTEAMPVVAKSFGDSAHREGGQLQKCKFIFSASIHIQSRLAVRYQLNPTLCVPIVDKNFIFVCDSEHTPVISIEHDRETSALGTNVLIIQNRQCMNVEGHLQYR